MNICIVEDDYRYAEMIAHEITMQIDGVSIRVFSTESSFREAFEELQASPPFLFLLDVMIRWSDPKENSDEADRPPPEYKYDYAGVRLLEFIKNSDALRDVPVVIHSMLEREELGLNELPPRTLIRQKDEGIDRLILTLRSCLAAQKELPKIRLKKAKAAGNAVTLAPEFMGMSIDLKKLWEAIRQNN